MIECVNYEAECNKLEAENDKYMESSKNKDAIIEKAYKDNKNLKEAIKNMVEVL